MAAREIVVDGTDGAGKSTLVARLVAALAQRGDKVVAHAPYRATEVYPWWETEPERAARTIVSGMQAFRSAHPEAEIIVWDRGWPTAYVSTNSAMARALFEPLPELTILLLNDERATLAKQQQLGSNAAWLCDVKLRELFQAAYRRMAAEMQGPTVWVFQAQERGYFDLHSIEAKVTCWQER